MFCKSCGAPLSDEARFCPVCGSPVPVAEEPEIASEEPVQNDFPTPGSAEPQSAQPDAFYSPAAPAEQNPYAQQPEQPVKPAKKSRLGLIIGIAAAVLVVLGGGLFAYASGVFATPVQKFKMYNTALLDTVTDPIVKAFDDVNEKNVGLDTDITFTASTNIDSYVNEILEDSSLLCQVNAPKAEKGTVGLKLNLMGEETIDAAFRWDEESVGVYVPDVGNSFYTVFFDSIEQLLTDSGMDEAAAEFEAELFEDRDELLPVSGDELRELLDRYEEVLFSSVTAENVLKERGEVELKGIRETVSATTIPSSPRERMWPPSSSIWSIR